MSPTAAAAAAAVALLLLLPLCSIGLKTVIEAATPSLAPQLAAAVSNKMAAGVQQKVRQSGNSSSSSRSRRSIYCIAAAAAVHAGCAGLCIAMLAYAGMQGENE